MSNDLHFKVSSALKDIIGRDLITDDFVAVFELVKNSYDAHASRVDVIFENIKSGNPKITIKDNGKGMSYDDLVNKWLFVAYSAKREGTEDEDLDYRSKIGLHRAFAGAKGIGRFSCDRLGKNLYLETTQENSTETETLQTNWENFENNLRNEFVDIAVIHETTNKNTYDIQHGTVLVIENLRSEWDSYKLLKLKESLAKLINPNTQNSKFKIFLEAPDFLDEDKRSNEEYNIINGEVKNFIFDTLQLKTTKITSEITADRKYITTELHDGGTLIYKIKEINKFELLPEIKYTIYYLNMSAKLTFTRRMGLPSNRFGHISLYKNGFRIYPYGEPGIDPLKIDARKAQGQRRYLGTRELIGQIEINAETNELKETSSRGDGLIRTPTYDQLEDCFWEVLRRLEKYVVDVQQWGLSIEDQSAIGFEDRVTNLIAKLSGSSEIIDFSYSDDFLNILEKSQSNSTEKIIKNLNRIAIESGNDELLQEINRANIRLEEIKLAKEEAETEARIEKERSNSVIKELEERVSENLFLKSVKSQDLDEIVSFIHHIGISSSILDNYLTGLHNEINEDDFDINEAKKILRLLIFENKKILNISRFATKANFKLTTESIQLDIVGYLKEYVHNIVELSNSEHTKVSLIDKIKKPIIRYFKPIELNILIDNFLSNSKKAEATKFTITLSLNHKNEIIIEIEDNGKGISKENLNRIFDFGFTTLSNGSGIGLHHVKEIVTDMGSTIDVKSKIKEGTIFTINLK